MKKLSDPDKNMVVMLFITVFVTSVFEYFEIPGILNFLMIFLATAVWLAISPFKMTDDV